ncbi:MAG: ribosome maturation factor RimM [Woeseiaceae bacterium]|nr:ribosome maturation factor RimM [Woeseiaceae bacterium]
MVPAGDRTARAPVVLGEVAGVYGVRGWVRIRSYTVPPEGLLDYRECLLGGADGWRNAMIETGRRQGKGIVLHLAGIDDRDAAQALIGCEIAVPREALPEPGDGRYYWTDLEGLEVRHTDGCVLGYVDHLIGTGANDVLVVRGDRDRLIPFVTESVVREVDLDDGVIVVDWPWD